MKELIEISIKDWSDFKNKNQKYYDVLDYAVVKDFEETLLIENSRIIYILKGGQVEKNMIRY